MDSRKNQPPRRRVYREQPRRNDYDEYDYELDYEEPRRRPLPPRPRSRKKRRAWPVLLTGCALGILLTVLGAVLVVVLAIRNTQGGSLPNLPILSSTRTFTKEEKQSLSSLGTLTQFQVCDKFGNVSVQVDPNAATPTITANKTVQATSQTAANQAFQGLAVQVTSPQNTASLSCTPSSSTTPTTQTSPNSSLLVNVVFPGSSGTLVRANTNSVDLTITLPLKSVQSDGPALSLNIETSVGNITVDGLSGLLNIRGGTGNVSVNHAALADNSHIDTGQGNVTFNGFLILPNSPGTSAHYFIRSEQGLLDVTLPGTTNATLDANTNIGTIKCEFPVTVQPDNGSASAHGPLTTSTPSTNSPVLVVDVSTGNINIHQLQSSS
ncbi:MAG TPA: hypothetical protein VL485_12795 [Ktedonobacteraceae bacterium]|jgi:cytoskeletal protein RodZ|nr:hypothetical protein [Ktedonobacteraceae bacterium]